MERDFGYIKEHIDRIRSEIKAAGGENQTELMAVTKYVDADRINYAIDNCGITLIGENRVQELVEKYPLLHLDGVRVHIIGTLQTNKVKYIIDKVDMIQSLDSEKLAAEIDRQAKKHDIVMDCLIEVNIGREENKSGVMPEEVLPLLLAVSKYENVRVCGLMTIAPFVDDTDEQYRYFSETKKLYETMLPRLSPKVKPVLSMGMSDSMDAAIRAGSHMVRIGTAIFGKRNR